MDGEQNGMQESMRAQQADGTNDGTSTLGPKYEGRIVEAV